MRYRVRRVWPVLGHRSGERFEAGCRIGRKVMLVVCGARHQAAMLPIDAPLMVVLLERCRPAGGTGRRYTAG